MEEQEVRLLDSNTANQIAAGEVVEKPASVVKELVENALDAGATSIEVTIFEGGVEYIRVADNGSGMSAENARMAVKRHATSKLRQADDLLQLHTLGFRGEALPSIASVSEFELLTRPETKEFATSLKIKGGEEEECMETGGPLGTTVIVKNLFFNVPARRKFLHTVTTEGRYISELLTKLALARPDVRFKLTNNDKEVLATQGTGDLRQTIAFLYGKKVAAELLPVAFANSELQINGYIGKPTLLKGNRSWQTLFVNGRVINNKMMSKAIEHAYQSQVPKSGFPFAVLQVQVDTQTIDVNVHPQKSEIKFSDEGLIYKSVYKALCDALLRPLQAQKLEGQAGGFDLEPIELAPGAGLARAAVAQEGTAAVEEAGAADQSLGVHSGPDAWGESAAVAAGTREVQAPRPAAPVRDTFSHKESIWKTPGSGFASGPLQVASVQLENKPQPPEAQVELEPLPGLELSTAVPAPAVSQAAGAPNENAVALEAAGTNGLATIWPLGQVDRTFIIAQSEQSLFLIDQHAAHERILYDRLVAQRKVVPAQQLLVPFYVDASAQDVELLDSYHEEFLQLGVDITAGGEESLRISSLPVDITAGAAADFIADIAQYLQEHKQPEAGELRQKVWHTAACHAAIKAGEVLNLQQMRQLIVDLCNTAHPFTCPHGRPCLIEITAAELYKMFKRTGFNL